MTPTRPYRSPVRDARTTDTRRRILSAVVSTMGQGLTELSVPAVAREAGVSVRTVYRHFPTKAGMVDALASDLYARDDLERVAMPTSPEAFEPLIRELFRRHAAIPPAARAVLLTSAGREARRGTIPGRLDRLRDALRSARPGIDDEVVEQMARVALVMTSSFAVQAWKDYLDATAEEAAADVAWALRALVAGARATE